jgi:mannose-1-phosphate guanylyltransferase
MLVGGFGTRLRPLTMTTPKPMLSLVNIPFLEIELAHLKQHGVDEVILSTGYLPAIFDEYFGDGSRVGMKLVHVTEDEPLGTCGAVKNVEQYLGEDPVIVCNGDQEKSATITITLTPVEDPTAYGLVPLSEDGAIKEFLEKPSWDEVVTNLINAGTYVIDPAVFKDVPENTNYSFERQLFPGLLERGAPMYGYPSDSYWLDLGTPEKYMAAHHDILERRIEVELRGKDSGDRVFLDEGVMVEKGAKLFGPSVIGRDTVVRAGASVGDLASIGNGVKIHADAKVERSIVMDGATIGKGCTVEDSIVGRETVLGPGCHVAEGSVLGDNIDAGGENEFRKGIRIWPSVSIKEGTIRF